MVSHITSTEAGHRLHFTAISEALGAEITGLDLTQPLEPLTKEALRTAFQKYRLLLIRDDSITAEEQVRFAEVFGEIVIRQDYETEPSKVTATQYVSNTREDGILGAGELDFHHDQLFQETPLRALILYGVEVPTQGGDTSFINTSRVLDAMPEKLKAVLRNKSCLHLYDFKGDYTGFQSLETATPGSPRASHPIIYCEPETGAEALWVNRLTTIRVNELPADESQTLIDTARSFLRNDAFIYRHRWRRGDLILWDNRILQHARGQFDPTEPRTLRRTPIL